MVKVWNPVTDVYDDYPLDPFAADSAVVHDTGDETVAGVKTFQADPIIPDEVYGAGWNGSLEPPTKNAVYDKIETIGGGGTVDVVSNVATSRILGRITAGSGDSEELTAAQVKTLLAILAADISDFDTQVATTAVLKSLFDANTILAATTDNTPAALTVGASTFVGRKAAGNIAAMSVAEAVALLASTMAADSALTGAFANKGLDGVLASASTTLTNHTPNNTSAEQWATEVATIAQADCPASAVVVASLDGWISPNLAGTPSAGNRGVAGLEVSFDGGSSWASMGPDQNISLPLVSSAGQDFPLSMRRRTTGTVTGDVKVRATCRDGDGANKTTFEGGYILAMVHPQ